MTYIVHWRQKTTKGTREVFRTVPPDGLTVAFRRRSRHTGQRIGGWPVTEDAGADKSQVYLKSRTDDTLGSRGHRSSIPHLTIRLLERHRSIRRLRSEDVETIAAIDERIAAKKAELAAIEQERHEAVAAAWKAGDKVDIEELEAKANA